MIGRKRTPLLALLALVVVIFGGGGAIPSRAQSDQQCFAETGYCIQGRIREVWQQSGGVAVSGLPLSPARQEVVAGESFVVQWFERTRLEYHPSVARPYDVQVGRVGVEVLIKQRFDWYTFPGGQPHDGCLFFSETGHSLCEPFLSYWRSHGVELDGRAGTTQEETIALYGLPISEPLAEPLDNGKAITVQWFERTRLEYHPENPPPYIIMAGRLGADLLPQTIAAAPTHGVIRVVNQTGWQLNYAIDGKTEEYHSVAAGEVSETWVGPGSYRISVSTRCDSQTSYFSLHAGETKEFAFACP